MGNDDHPETGPGAERAPCRSTPVTLGLAPLGAPHGKDAAEQARLERLMSLGQLVPAIAHELGNPLAIIISSLQYACRQLAVSGHPADEWTRTALDQAENMQRLIRSMLDMGAARRPSAQLSDLNGLLHDTLLFVAPESRRLRVELATDLHRGLTPAWVDREGFRQCALNIVKNALEAMGERGGVLLIRTRPRPDGGGAIVEFENDGPPIPQDVLPRIFQPFATTKDCGTGLGLYLCREFAREHRGRIDAENVSGGVRFALAVPFDRRKEPR